jgi:SAM-dependent methyltransferase
VTANDDAAARYERERAFHDERYHDDSNRARAEKFYEAGDAAGDRYRGMLAEVPSTAKVLEYGCGTGSAAFDLAARGIEVVGIDISPVAIEVAEMEARSRGVAALCRFEVMNAEALELSDSSFDVVCGSGVLHHLDLANAFPEVARVLKPTGWAAFVEPLGHNPLINAYRRRTPEMRTPDEHPLRVEDFHLARSHFAAVDVEYFNLFTIAGVPFRRFRFNTKLRAGLHRADQWLFRRFARLRRHAWVAVVRLARPGGLEVPCPQADTSVWTRRR